MRQLMVGHNDPIMLRTNKVHCDGKSSGITMDFNPKQNQRSKKPKRFRSAFTTEQVDFLETQFKKFPYINKDHRIQIATILKMDERPVKIWFQNRRMKEKKENQKERSDEIINCPQVLVKNQFSNVPTMPSTNDQCSYSLLSSTADATEKINTGYKRHHKIQHKEKLSSIAESKTKLNVEIKSAQSEAKYYKEAENEEHVSPYFYSPRTKITKLPITVNIENKKPPSQDAKRRTSAEFSINLCKQYKRKSVAIIDTAYDNADQEQKKDNLEPEKLQCTSKHLKLPKQVNATMPEVLSASKGPKLTHPEPPQASRPVEVNNSYYPVMPTIYTPPLMSSGGVLWKPVNLMPVMAPNSSNHPGITFHEKNKTCECNCHGISQHIPVTFPHSFQNPYAQYVLTIPYQHTSPKY